MVGDKTKTMILNYWYDWKLSSSRHPFAISFLLCLRKCKEDERNNWNGIQRGNIHRHGAMEIEFFIKCLLHSFALPNPIECFEEIKILLLLRCLLRVALHVFCRRWQTLKARAFSQNAESAYRMEWIERIANKFRYEMVANAALSLKRASKALM